MVVFTGMVQGVGFRYTARELAEQFAISGYVRNCSDGAVEAVVEGEAAEIDAFVEALSSRMADYVRKVTHRGDMEGFTIRH
jgi:acylphosphatase